MEKEVPLTPPELATRAERRHSLGEFFLNEAMPVAAIE